MSHPVVNQSESKQSGAGAFPLRGQLKLNQQNNGKFFLIGMVVLIWVLLLVLFRLYGYEKTWQLWNVPTQGVFLDFRLIPGSAESFRHGFEPTQVNPYDPTERIFNYPAFWRLFFYTGITMDDTVWIGISMIVLFFIAVLLLPDKLSVAGAVGMLFVIFSPASMLLYERGNVDLIVFFICVMILLAASYSANLAALLIMFGSIVKMFPFFGVSILLKESRRRFLLLFAACTAVLVVYMAATWSSVKASWNLTMRGDGLSYGTNVFVTRYGEAIARVIEQWLTPHRTDLLLKYGPLLAGLTLLFVAAVLAFLTRQQPETHSERHFAAFRMGASIYVGTFLLGNNFDYRLAFLILVVPQLVEWVRATNKTYRILAWISLFLVLASCWHLWISEIPLQTIFPSIDDSRKFWIILDEIFNWLLFASLAYLLVASTPDWLRGQVRSFLPANIIGSSKE